MRPRFRPIWTTLALLIAIEPRIGRAADIGWLEAVGRRAGERAKAETCVALLKGYGDEQQSSQGQLAYGEAARAVERRRRRTFRPTGVIANSNFSRTPSGPPTRSTSKFL
jgi:hypothetical protein